MLLKLLGLVAVAGSSMAFGFSMSNDYQKRIKELMQINKMLLLLKGEIIHNESTRTTKIYNQINNYICTPTNAIGVYSKSANKDLAVDALFNVVFNKEINNIITFGIESEQYILKDGIVEMNDVDENNISSSVDTTFNNPLISYQCYHYFA